MEATQLKTPLYAKHLSLGGKMAPFAGYLLPVNYPSGVIAEHMCVRRTAGLFDVSHMGEVIVEGRDALTYLNYLLCNDFTSLKVGRARYSPMLNERGGVVDDLIIHRLGADKYLAVVNAANREKDLSHMRRHAAGEVSLRDLSGELSSMALQGPLSRAILESLPRTGDLPALNYSFTQIELGGIPCLAAATGYTGEWGYELYVENGRAPELWDALLEAGAPFGLMPCGLGARDTLRLEAGMPLYGHEMDEDVSPLEAGLGWAVKLDARDFIGHDALMKDEPMRERVGLKMTGRGIARECQTVYRMGEAVGRTTSGTHLPFVGCACAMALFKRGAARVGDEVEVDVRGRRVSAVVTGLPFYRRENP